MDVFAPVVDDVVLVSVGVVVDVVMVVVIGLTIAAESAYYIFSDKLDDKS